MQTHDETDILRNINVLRDEANRARKWADIRRNEAKNEDARAEQLDRRVATLEAMLPGLADRWTRTERRHARARGC